MNSYNKIWQTMIINVNENAFMKKIYAVFIMNLKTSDKKMHSSFLYIIISHIIFSNKLKNELFWNQIAFQNTRKKIYDVFMLFKYWQWLQKLYIS